MRALSKVYDETTEGLQRVLTNVKMLISSLETSDLIKATEFNDALLVRKFKSLDEHYQLLTMQVNNESKTLFLTPVGQRFLSLFALRFKNSSSVTYTHTIQSEEHAQQQQQQPQVFSMDESTEDTTDFTMNQDISIKEQPIHQKELETIEEMDDDPSNEQQQSSPSPSTSVTSSSAEASQHSSHPMSNRTKQKKSFASNDPLTTEQKRLVRLREAKAFSFGSMSRRYL